MINEVILAYISSNDMMRYSEIVVIFQNGNILVDFQYKLNKCQVPRMCFTNLKKMVSLGSLSHTSLLHVHQILKQEVIFCTSRFWQWFTNHETTIVTSLVYIFNVRVK